MLGGLISGRSIKRRDANIQYDKFHSIAKGHVHQRPHRIAHPLGHALGGMAEEARQRDDGYGVQPKDNARFEPGGLCCNSDRDKYQQQVDITREYDGFGREPKPDGNILLLLVGLLVFYDRPLPLSLRRWSGRRVIGRCLVCHMVGGRIRGQGRDAVELAGRRQDGLVCIFVVYMVVV